MEILTSLWDGIYALCVGVIAGVLIQRLGMVDWMMSKLMGK